MSNMTQTNEDQCRSVFVSSTRTVSGGVRRTFIRCRERGVHATHRAAWGGSQYWQQATWTAADADHCIDIADVPRGRKVR